jgi:hypothetical protein
MTDREQITPDPVRDFEHDHARLGALLSEVRELIQSLQKKGRFDEVHGALCSRLDDLREELLFHFVREEEALFPFIAEQLPDLRDAVARLQSSHDTICGTVLRMSHMTGALSGRLPRFLVLFERFEEAYSIHARDEREVLRNAGSRLGPEQRRLLAELVLGL